MPAKQTQRTAVPAHLAPGAQASGPGASNRQLDFIIDLLGKRVVPNRTYEELKRRTGVQREANRQRGDKASPVLDGLTSRVASTAISQLLERPMRPQEDRPGQGGDELWSVVDANTWAQMGQPSTPGEELWVLAQQRNAHGPGMHEDVVVPRGSYALENLYYKGELLDHSLGNDVAFYSVWISKDGSRWSVKRYSSDELVGLPRAQQYGILERIAQDPAAAAEKYGLLIGKCGICHRTLTNQESRERGIGPVCAEKHGW